MDGRLERLGPWLSTSLCHGTFLLPGPRPTSRLLASASCERRRDGGVRGRLWQRARASPPLVSCLSCLSGCPLHPAPTPDSLCRPLSRLLPASASPQSARRRWKGLTSGVGASPAQGCSVQQGGRQTGSPWGPFRGTEPPCQASGHQPSVVLAWGSKFTVAGLRPQVCLSPS